MISVDALTRKDKVDVVASSRIICKSSAQSTRPLSVSISIGRHSERREIPAEFLVSFQKALDLGMRALIGPRLLGYSLAIRGFDDECYEPIAAEKFVVCAGLTNTVDSELLSRGVGRARAIKLGCEDIDDGEWWPQGLERAITNGKLKKVREVINEWIDGEAIAAHVGYGNDFFCTHDKAGKAGQNSVFHKTHCNWLTERYGVKFVTLQDLADYLQSVIGAQ
ncbi:hypothetical protein HWE04_01230 [Herbaspirillum sp. C7C2]|uniref:hypothetical protein n=1 Tax=Herbaspirillum sp. C7C2 TaxID=2736666 RepID=UPI001F515922|nr:hypothetical protein [Herbaspirillum sp. C7C2]MCI1012461.1 hypothetical protein [Herbaspirillum sp. C7C2]